MIEKYRDGIVPEGGETTLDAAGARSISAYTSAMDAYDLKGGAEAAWTLVNDANQFIVQSAPWTLAKEGRDAELNGVLAALARCLIRLAVLTSPFLPSKAEELWAHLGLQERAASSSIAWAERPTATGLRVRKPAGLFPKQAIANS
jgi:methionyl-tRNA synthetase